MSRTWPAVLFPVLESILTRAGESARARDGPFGYKIHMLCSTGPVSVPPAVIFTTANIPDKKMFVPLMEQMRAASIKFVAVDLGYSDQKLYLHCLDVKRIRMVCPAQERKSTNKIRREMARLYRSREGRAEYRKRGMTAEPLFERI